MGDSNRYLLSQALVFRLPAAQVPGGAFPSRSTFKGLFLRPRLATSQSSMYVLG